MLELIHKTTSAKSKTVKLVWQSNERKGRIFETSIVPSERKGHYSICLSSQCGCSYKCSFCASTKYTYPSDKNLTTDELLSQARQSLRVSDKVFSNLRLFQFSFMGIGEPLDNFDNIYNAISAISDRGYSTSLATIGHISGLQSLIEKSDLIQPKLRLSLHAFRNRQSLIPAESIYPASRAIPLCNEYSEKTGTQLTIAWLLLKGINDTYEDAEEIGFKFNPQITRVHLPTYLGNVYETPSLKEKEMFRDRITQASRLKWGEPITVDLQNILGGDIEAGCGQLVGKYYDREL